MRTVTDSAGRPWSGSRSGRGSRATVFRAVTELEEIGELKRETGGGGRHRPNVYRVMPDHVDNSEEGSQAETGKGLRLRQKGLTPGTRKGLTVATQNHQNRKEPRATFNSAIPDDFDPDISGHVADIRAGLRKGPK